MFSIANLANEQDFFTFVYAHNRVKDKDMVGLKKDTIHSLATIKISSDRYIFY